MADSSVTVTIKVDLSGFTAAIGMVATGFSGTYTRAAIAAEESAARVSALQGGAVDEMDPWIRWRRRIRTHVVETSRGSRMHAAYRAKTRRRNRRG